MIHIAGRPRRNWDCQIREVDGALVVRLDDRDDPEFWCEVSITGDDLFAACIASARTSAACVVGCDPRMVQLPVGMTEAFRMQLGGRPLATPPAPDCG